MANPIISLPTLASQLTYKSRVDTILGSAFVELFPANNKRWSLMFCNGGPDNILIFFEPNAGNDAQVIVYPNNTPTILTFKDLGPLIGKSIFAISTGGGGSAVLNSWSVEIIQ